MHPFSLTTRRIKSFACDHDDIPAFHAAYLVGTFLAAALFNLGFFLLLIVGHMCLDYVKYRDTHHFGFGWTIVAILRESLADFALLLMATVFVVYFNHAFALSAMSGLARAEFTLLRAIGMLIPKIEILERMIVIVMNIERYMHTLVIDPRARLTAGERWSIGGIVASLIAIGIAMYIYRGNEATLFDVLEREFSLTL